MKEKDKDKANPNLVRNDFGRLVDPSIPTPSRFNQDICESKIDNFGLHFQENLTTKEEYRLAQ